MHGGRIINTETFFIYLILAVSKTLQGTPEKRKNITYIKGGDIGQRHFTLTGPKTGVIFSDELSLPFENGKDLTKKNVNLKSVENVIPDDLQLYENLWSYVSLSSTEMPKDSSESNAPKTKFIPDGRKSRISALKDDEYLGEPKEMKELYRKIALDFELLEDFLSKQKPKVDGRKAENDGSKNVLTIEDVPGREGPLTRITLVRRHVIEKKKDLEIPSILNMKSKKRVKLEIKSQSQN